MISATNFQSTFSANANKSNLHLMLLQQNEMNSATIQQQQQQQQQGLTTAQRYKTELCRSFQENGTCKYGDKCQFAHGHHELRSMQRHPKYKSELCRTFHAQGYCPYGPRCHFVHEIQNTATKALRSQPWINTVSDTWSSPQYHSQPGSKSVSPKANGGLLMCALSGSNSSLFGEFSDNGWSDSAVASSEISPTSSRSLSPEGSRSEPLAYDDVDFSTTMLVNQILNNINNNSNMQYFMSN